MHHLCQSQKMIHNITLSTNFSASSSSFVSSIPFLNSFIICIKPLHHKTCIICIKPQDTDTENQKTLPQNPFGVANQLKPTPKKLWLVVLIQPPPPKKKKKNDLWPIDPHLSQTYCPFERCRRGRKAPSRHVEGFHLEDLQDSAPGTSSVKPQKQKGWGELCGRCFL